MAESELSNDKQANGCTLLCDFCGYVNLLMMLTVTACMKINFVVFDIMLSYYNKHVHLAWLVAIHALLRYGIPTA